ncbi:MAG: BrnT family toxin [Saprospiraceae bacterium]
MDKKFEWDPNKNASNLEKHGVSFDDVTDIFDDENRIQYIQYVNGERRWKTVGSILGILFSVVYTMRKAVFRLISARRASKQEKKDYTDNINKR